MNLGELTQPGWGDAADYFRERDKKYSMTELKVPAGIQRQTEEDAPHSHRRHLVSLWRLLIVSPENRKCRKSLPKQGLVI